MARRVEDINAELAVLRRQRDAERARLREWQLSARARHVCLIIFDQACANAEPCAVYLKAHGLMCHWSVKDEDELRAIAEQLFLDITSTPDGLAAYAALVDLDNPSDATAARDALRYSEEWHVVEWAREQNADKSVAPGCDQLLDHLEQRRVRLPEAVRPPPRGTSLDAGARKWASRLRGRWGGFIDRFKVRDELPVSEMRDRAYAAMQWWRHLQSKTPPGTAILRVNLDETSIALHQGGGAGSIFVGKRKMKEIVEVASTSKRRCYMSHIALICDRSDLQPRLPQVVVANEHTIRVRDLPALRAACPPNVVIIRQKSAWNNDVLCALIIGLLKKAVAAHAGGARIVLLLDCCRVHTTPRIMRACRRHGIWPLFIPAKLTWLLQPLDTHAFALFKHALRMAHQRARVASPDGNVTMSQFLQCLYDAIRTVLQGRRWSTAFESNGFGSSRLSPRVALALQIAEDPILPSTRPSDAQLRICFPRNARVPAVWGPVDAGPAPLWGARARGRGRGGAAVAGAAAAAVARGRGHAPSRTRSGLVYRAD